MEFLKKHKYKLGVLALVIAYFIFGTDLKFRETPKIINIEVDSSKVTMDTISMDSLTFK